MKIRYEMRTSLGRERRSFSVSTTAVAKAGKIYLSLAFFALIPLFYVVHILPQQDVDE